jgi:hypothetical protein
MTGPLSRYFRLQRLISCILSFTNTIYFTFSRNSGIAIVYIAACLGSAAAPFVLELDRIHPILPFGLMGGLAVVAALLGLLLPETRGRPTAEVFESKNSGIQSRIIPQIRIVQLYVSSISKCD